MYLRSPGYGYRDYFAIYQKKDFGKKLEKYVDAGVREYWIVDAKNHKVIVYDLGEDFGEIGNI